MNRVLMVDDDPQIRRLVRTYVINEGYECDEAENGEKALDKCFSREYDIIILDVMMPQLDGWETLKKIREFNETPVIMLTARTEEEDKLLGFGLGADDFVAKPFSPRELMARMKAMLKRVNKQLEPSLLRFFGELEINEMSRSVNVGKKTISLTPKEFEVLLFLSSNPNQVFSRDQLLDKVWGYDYFGDSRTVDTHIKSLRERLGKYRKCIATVWGVGYRFDSNLDVGS